MLPLLSAYARPQHPCRNPDARGSSAPQRNPLRSAAQGYAALTEALIDKYVTALQQLGLLEAASGAHVA